MTRPAVLPGYVEFLALNTDGTVRCPLPDVQTWTLSPLLNDAGAVQLTYPANGVNFDVLHENITQDRDLNVRVVVAGVVRPELQAILAESSGDDVDPEAVWTFSGNFTEQWLTEAVVVPNGGQPSQEVEGEENDTHFYSATAGTILRTLLAEAVARGALTHLDWSSFSNTLDSTGASWSQIITLKFSPGLTFLDVAKALVEYGMCEFEMLGNQLQVYDGDSHSVDRTLTDPPVILRAGRDISDSPRRHSVRDTATTLLVAGGEGVYHTETDATALAKRGRRIESFSSQQNITDPGVLTAYTQHALTGLVNGVMEKTHGLALGDGPRPGDDFDVGDWVFSDVGAGRERLRVKQWTISGAADGRVPGSVVLNDLIAEREARLARRIKGIEGGSTVTGTSQARPIPDNLVDNIGPKTPVGLVVTSLAYTVNGVIEAAAAAQWDPVTLNSDNTAIDDLDYYVLQWRYTNPDKANIVGGVSLWKLGGIPTDPYFSWSGLAPGEEIEVRVAARDKAGNYAPFTPITTHILAADDEDPPTPSTPITSTLFGSTRVEWDGLGSVGEEMPSDLLRVQVHASEQSGFTPTGATLYTTMSGPGVTAYSAAGYGVTVFFRFVAEDRSGNLSAASTQASGTARQAVEADVFAGAIGSASLADLAVVRAKIANLAVNNAKVADLSVGKLTAGTLQADVTIAATFATALSGGRVGFNASEFFAYSPTDVQTVRIGDDGSATFLGEIATAASGERFALNPGGTAPAELRVFPDTGTDNYTRIKAGTVTDGLGGEHSLLSIIGDRYAGDVGEPYVEMYGTQGTLGWGDHAGQTPGFHNARVLVDRYGPRLYGSVIELNCMDRSVISPDNFVKITFHIGGSVEIMRSLIPDVNYQLIRGTNHAVLLHHLGMSARNRADTTDTAMYASAFNAGSGRRQKTDVRELREAVVTGFDSSASSVWRYADEVAEVGDAARWHVGPMADSLPAEFVSPGVARDTDVYVNVDDKVGIMWEVLRRTRNRVGNRISNLEQRITALEARP